MTMNLRNRKRRVPCFLPFFKPILHVEFRPKMSALAKMFSSFSFVVSFVIIIMTRSANQTTIAVSREHYNALIKLGGKNETFDQIVGKLLKNASMNQNE